MVNCLSSFNLWIPPGRLQNTYIPSSFFISEFLSKWRITETYFEIQRKCGKLNLIETVSISTFASNLSFFSDSYAYKHMQYRI